MSQHKQEKTCLAFAMDAKQKIFAAQDAAEEFTNETLRRETTRLLARVRADLEALDRLLRNS